jgi:hypothetical protein
MSDIVFYTLLQVIIILAMAAFLFFSLWRSARSLASNYHELANPADTTENTLEVYPIVKTNIFRFKIEPVCGFVLDFRCPSSA